MFTENSTVSVFYAILLMIAIPAIVISYFAMKIPQYAKPVGIIFILAFGSAIGLYVTFGYVSPDQYMVASQVDEVIEEIIEVVPTGPVFSISILAGSAEQGNPDYEPDEAFVPQGHVIKWTKNDEMSHTVTSSIDFGETFDSCLLNVGEIFALDSNELDLGSYEYLCIVHPWMISTIVIEEPVE